MVKITFEISEDDAEKLYQIRENDEEFKDMDIHEIARRIVEDEICVRNAMSFMDSLDSMGS